MAAATDSPLGPDNSVTTLINTLITSLKPLYDTLIITCIWSAMLVPLFVILLFFSDRESRRKSIFIANLFAIFLGIVYAGVILALMVSNWLHYGSPSSSQWYINTVVSPLGPARPTQRTSVPHIRSSPSLQPPPNRIRPSYSTMGRLLLPVHPPCNIFRYIHPHRSCQDRPSHQRDSIPSAYFKTIEG